MTQIHFAAISFVSCVLAIGSAAAADNRKCENLVKLHLDGAVITHAESAGPDFMSPPTPFVFQGALPVSAPVCRVSIAMEPTIAIEVWLPTEGHWNGKLQGVGNGGMAGGVNYVALKTGVEMGFATVSSDLGHEGNGVDGSFAVNNPQKVIDWGYRATHEMTVQAKAVIAAFYGRHPKFSYFTGCSGGGRQGLMEAQRFPEDYNGILAGDPTINFTRLTTAGRLWQIMSMMREANGAGYIAAEKIPALAAAVNAACDAHDGVKDGVLDDPRQCHFDPATIQCTKGDGPECLTAPQVAALNKIYHGAVNSKGEQLFPGYEPGGEMGNSGWERYIIGKEPLQSTQWLYASGFLKGLVYEDPSYDPATFDFDADITPMEHKSVLGQALASVINAGDPDLTAFKKHAGKLILYHGWSDPGVPPLNSVHYYESVATFMASSQGREPAPGAAMRDTQSFFRLFMAPGMQHCTDGPGPNAFGGFVQAPVPDDASHNALRALEKWVENGSAPQRIIATKYVDDKPEAGIARTRPLCPYPQVAKYNGVGNANDASHFVCK